MNSKVRDKALKKIAKCLELGNSNNVNEAAQAIKMAHSLMMKYGLDSDDVEFIKMGKTTAETYLPSVVSNNILRIIRGINRSFGVECVLTNHKTLKKADFIGDASRAIFAAFAFDVIYREMNHNVGQFRIKLSEGGIVKKERTKRVNSYASGWIEGAINNLPLLNSTDSRDKLSSFIDKEFEGIDREMFKIQMSEAIKGLTKDYDTGMKKGQKTSINRPVEGNSKVIKQLMHI